MSIPVISFADYFVMFEALDEEISMREYFIKNCEWSESKFRKIKDCAWFCAKVSIWRDGAELACDYLGTCCYLTESEFFNKYRGDYFADMVKNCADEIKDAGLSAMVNLWHSQFRQKVAA